MCLPQAHHISLPIPVRSGKEKGVNADTWFQALPTASRLFALQVHRFLGPIGCHGYWVRARQSCVIIPNGASLRSFKFRIQAAGPCHGEVHPGPYKDRVLDRSFPASKTERRSHLACIYDYVGGRWAHWQYEPNSLTLVCRVRIHWIDRRQVCFSGPFKNVRKLAEPRCHFSVDH